MTPHAVRPETDRAPLAGDVAGARHLPRRNRPAQAQVLRARHVSVPVRRRSPRRPPEGLHRHRHLARYKRMRGFNVLHPMGWDAFGLPAEQYAIETGTHPRVTTRRNIETFKRQIDALGFSYDWSREIDTTDPGYFRWTQWIFCKLFERGLAYEAEVPVNWCPALGTVLANEEVIDGKSERGGHPVVRLPMQQWMLRITAYADRLLADLDGARLARADQEDAAQLDRPQRGRAAALPGRRSQRPRDRRLHDAARHALRRHLHGAGAGARAGRRRSRRPRSARPSRPTSKPPRARATARASPTRRRRPASPPAPSRSIR